MSRPAEGTAPVGQPVQHQETPIPISTGGDTATRSAPPARPLVDIFPGPADPPLIVLFCGVNPGKLTITDGLHFGRPGNRFWPVLYGAGFTPHLFSARDQFELAGLGCGITSLVPRPPSRAEELSTAELRAGVPRLTDTVRRTQPHWVGFLGVTSFRLAFRRPQAQFGPQPDPVGQARLWVLPNPSGLNRSWPLPRLITEYRRFHDIAMGGTGGLPDPDPAVLATDNSAPSRPSRTNT